MQGVRCKTLGRKRRHDHDFADEYRKGRHPDQGQSRNEERHRRHRLSLSQPPNLADLACGKSAVHIASREKRQWFGQRMIQEMEEAAEDADRASHPEADHG